MFASEGISSCTFESDHTSDRGVDGQSKCLGDRAELSAYNKGVQSRCNLKLVMDEHLCTEKANSA